MPELTVKTIKGNKYLYLRDRVKVNLKSLPLQIYVGRLEKVDPEDILPKRSKLQTLRLTTYLDYRLEHYSFTALDRTQASDLETLRYFYGLFEEFYPDESERYVDALYLRYVQGTTAIEGNTIGLREAQELLEHNISPAGKRMDEVYEILNFINLRRYLEEYSGDITEKLIRKIHEILMNEVLRNPGEYRNIQVGIEQVDYAPPPAILVPEEMRALTGWYRQNNGHLNPFELAVLLHTKFEMIHPLVDGNGRVGRALMNLVLERAGYPTLYLGLEHRSAYLDALTKADDGDYRPIIETLYAIYREQHGRIAEEVRQKLSGGNSRIQEENARIIRQFVELKKKA
ncbi:Fic family protein [Methanoculleus sp. UBA303]|jgi:Fic family protein|uniref:Fic family protein n=1 Tax=Methanoculleus sp. UBA303 TaxID=1915497 RepID=UPI0025F3FA4A|nr:Fic family protein [Methanoculleus sp. UBA303]